MKEIIQDIDKTISDYARKNNFDIILHGSAILYGDKGMDVTAEILKAVNAIKK
jgi:Skp family chaperone for outer membrane proteins